MGEGEPGGKSATLIKEGGNWKAAAGGATAGTLAKTDEMPKSSTKIMVSRTFAKVPPAQDRESRRTFAKIPDTPLGAGGEISVN